MVREMVHEKVRGTAPETALSTVRGLELSMVLVMELSMEP